MRLIYIDDSGSPQAHTTVFGWVETQAENWRAVLRIWLDWRHELHRTTGISSGFELHATSFLGGRGRPTGTNWDLRKVHRVEVVEQALRTIGSIPGLNTGAVFQRSETVKGSHKSETYARLVNSIDERLTREGDFGIIIMDGDGTDPTYRVPHRALTLATRSLIEDPLFQVAHSSQWVQMADLVAYTAYMRVARSPRRRFSWGWYEMLAHSSVTGPEPVDVKTL